VRTLKTFQGTHILDASRGVLCASLASLVGIHLTATLSAVVHVEHILSLANQRLHLLGLLKYEGLSLRLYI